MDDLEQQELELAKQINHIHKALTLIDEIRQTGGPACASSPILERINRKKWVELEGLDFDLAEVKTKLGVFPAPMGPWMGPNQGGSPDEDSTGNQSGNPRK